MKYFLGNGLSVAKEFFNIKCILYCSQTTGSQQAPVNRYNANEVLAAGADSLAVISAVLDAENVEEASRQIVDRLNTQK